MLGGSTRGKIVLLCAAVAIGIAAGYALLTSALPGTVEIASTVAEGATPDDGIVPAAFFLEIDGEIVAALNQVSGIAAETEVIESKQGASKDTAAKLAGETNYSNVVLRRGLTEDMTFSD